MHLAFIEGAFAYCFMLLCYNFSGTIMNKQLFPFIFKRKSTRFFKSEGLNDQQVADLLLAVQEIKNFTHFELDYRIDYVESSQLKHTFNVKAPGALVFSTIDHPLAYIFTGMMMQQVDLICSSKNIASCWLGVASAEDFGLEPDKKVTGVLAVGLSDKDIHRSNVDQFKRLPMSIIRDNGYYDHIIEAVRLAPSSMNQQFWMLSVLSNEIILRQRKGFNVSGFLLNRLHQIDCGIAMAHLAISLDYHNYQFTCVLNESIIPNKDWVAQFLIET